MIDIKPSPLTLHRRFDRAFATLLDGSTISSPQFIFEVIYEPSHYTPKEIAQKYMEDTNWTAKSVIVLRLAYPDVIPARISVFRAGDMPHGDLEHDRNFKCMCRRKAISLMQMEDFCYVDEERNIPGGILEIEGWVAGDEKEEEEEERMVVELDLEIVAKRTLLAMEYMKVHAL